MRLRLRHRYLARLLARENLSQNRWAQKLGFSSAHLSLLVNGHRPYPSAATRRKLLKGLHLKQDDLFEVELPVGEATRGRVDVPPPRPGNDLRRQVPNKGGAMLSGLSKDFKYGIRRLGTRPAISLIVILSLALGIGANSAVFSLVDALLFKPLPVRDPQQLVALATSDHHSEYPHGLSYRLYRDFLTLSEAFSEVVAFQNTLLNIKVNDQTSTVISLLSTGNYFDSFGVQPFLGRLFQASDAGAAAPPVIVASHALWQNLFAGDPGAVGKTVNVNGHSFTLIGVTPPAFRGTSVLSRPSAWVPLPLVTLLSPEQPDFLEDRDAHNLSVWARLQEETSFSRAQAAVDGRMAQLQQEYSATDRSVHVNLYPEWEARFEAGSGAALAGMSALLSGVALFVLLIACANVANLLLAQATGRRREVALRLAVGASRHQLIRQLVVEGLILALVASGLAFLLARLGAVYLKSGGILSSEELGLGIDVVADNRVLFFTVVLAICSALFFAIVPAFQSTRADMVASLKNEERIEPVRGFRIPLSKVLVSAQVTICFVLLIFAALFVQTLGNAQQMDLGLRKENLLLGSIYPVLMGYPEEKGRQLYSDLLERLRARPEVEHAAIVNPIPMDWILGTSTVIVEGREISGDEPEEVGVLSSAASDGYFQAAGTTMVRGRVFDARDTLQTQLVAVINETAAKQLWPDREALGSRFWIDSRSGAPITVIGIARDGKYRNYNEPPQAYFFLPLSQHYKGRATVLLTGPSTTAQRAQVLRQELAELDDQMALQGVKDISVLLNERAFSSTRLATTILLLFGAIGLTLASIGLFGVASYSVRKRTREIGIRMALGAHPREIRWMILRNAIVMTGAGLGAGIVVALGLARVAGSIFFGISPNDPLTFAVIVLVLCATSGLAAFLPARQATRVDPLTALRYD